MIEKMLLEQEAQRNGQSVEEFVYAIFKAQNAFGLYDMIGNV